MPAIVHEVLRSPGQPLDATTRAFMEPRFNHDFSQVRVHRDERAAESARAVDALAYTVGTHVVFASSSPGIRSVEGRSLLGHELSHVVQQSGRGAISADGSIEMGEDSPLEQEADLAAQAIGRNLASVRGHLRARPALMRSTQADSAPASPSHVELVRVSCESMTIEFETNAGPWSYVLTDCELGDVDYIATVTVTRNNVHFSGPPESSGGGRFPYDIKPGQPNPSTFFRGQKTVRIVTGTLANKLTPTSAPGPTPSPSPGSSQQTGSNTKSGSGRLPLICSRPLDFPLLNWRYPWLRLIRHAFVHDPPANYAIRRLCSGNGVTTSCAEKTDASGSPDVPATSWCGTCKPKQGQTGADVSSCIRAAHSAYSNPNVYRNLPDRNDSNRHGPNSNTYAATLAKCCDAFNPLPLGLLPGWDHSPAGTCACTNETDKQDEARPEGEVGEEGGDSSGGGASDSWSPDAEPSASPPTPPPDQAQQKLEFYHGTRWSVAKQIPQNVKPRGGGDFATGFYTHYDVDGGKALSRAVEWGRVIAKKPPQEPYAGVVRFDVPGTDYSNLFSSGKGKAFQLTRRDQPDYKEQQKSWLDFVTTHGREKDPTFVSRRRQWVHQRREPQPALGYNVIKGPFYAPLRGTKENQPKPEEFGPYAEGAQLPQQVLWANDGIQLLNSAKVKTELMQFDAKSGKRQDPPN